MSGPNIVTDPDGTRWVSVNVTDAQMRLLGDEATFKRFVVNFQHEMWAEFLRRIDEMVLGPFNEEDR